ncbi:phage tail tape measure protein [Azospirillum sp. SYSU D00513]|uniref:phage tail tape measure protein n=1 Tax=Azospirillum sp. SYSU D00513 TaxID=2812561 RepID=UPI001A958B22|nr:phage tail tape measure protein [Azospirillum sp. SYSU D00513]
MAGNFALKAVISVVDKVTGPMKGINRSLSGIGRRVGEIGAAGIGLGAAFGIQQIASDAINFEAAMAGVKKVVDFPTPEAFAQMGEDVLGLSKRIPMAAEGLADIVAAAGQSGIARDELLGFAEDAAKMGVAFDLTADVAGDMMAKWRTAFKMDQGQVRELADQVNYLGNTGPANAAQISDVVRRVGALGDVAGVQAKYVAALGATMVGTGAESEVAATATKNFMLALVKGEAATKGQKEAFAAMGISTTSLAKAMQKDATGAILKVLGALQKLPEHKQAAAMSELFGTESIGAIAPLLTNLDLLRDNIGKVSDATKYGGAMQREYDGQADTTKNKLVLLNNQWTALKITLGNSVLPMLGGMVGPLGAIIDKVAILAKQNPTLVKYALAFLGIGSAVGVAVGAIALGAGAFAALGAAALPIALIAAAVIGLGLAAYALYENWDVVGPWFSKLWDGVRQTFDGFVQFVKAIFTGDMDAAWAGLQAMASGYIAFYSTIWNGVKAAFNAFVGWIDSTFGTDLAGSLAAGWAAAQAVLAPIEAWATALWGSVRQIFSGFTAFVKAVWAGDMTAAVAALRAVWDGLTGYFTTLWNGITAVVSGAVPRLQALVAGWVPKPVMDAWGAVSGFFKGLWDEVTASFQKAWSYIEPIVAKIAAAVDLAKGAVGIVGGAAGAVTGAVSTSASAVSNAATGAWNWMIGADEAPAATSPAPVAPAPSAPGVGPSPVLAAGTQAQQLRGEVNVNFSNVPQGTRVEASSENRGVDLNPNVGYRSVY